MVPLAARPPALAVFGAGPLPGLLRRLPHVALMGERQVATEAITRQRFEEWADGLREAHATPALLVAVGHDAHAGEMHVYTPEGQPDHFLIGWLTAALEQVSGRRVVLR